VTGLEARDLVFAYGNVSAVAGTRLSVTPGRTVALIGTNGAGKSTVAKLLSGLLRPNAGTVVVDGVDVTRLTAAERAGAGVSLVPEGRRLFARQSVRVNLELGAFRRRTSTRELRREVDAMCETFPVLAERMDHPAGMLSGGEQQMVAIARALMGRPRYLLIDEPSMGLSPIMVTRLRSLLGPLRQAKLGIVLIEQNAQLALSLCDYVYVMQAGRIVHQQDADGLGMDGIVREIYLGGGSAPGIRQPLPASRSLPLWLRRQGGRGS